MVFFFKFIDGVDKDTGEEKKIPLLKYYPVFHISQCDGMKPRFASSFSAGSDLKPDVRAEQILNDYVRRSGVTLKVERSNTASYSPSLDRILVPELSQYSDLAEFYSTAYHEAVHSTGHPKRLNRITDTARFGSETYSKEELIAELGSAYLCQTAGLDTSSSFVNSVAYLRGWLKALTDDKRLIVSAAGKADKAVQYILRDMASTSEKYYGLY